MQTIDRVDELVRKNNAKYKDQQSQKAYEQALRDYERQAKAQLARQYAETVKEGNRRAVEKAKQAKKQKAKSKAKRVPKVPAPQQQPQKQEGVKKRMSQAEVQVVRQTIQARAQRIMQEQQLQRVSRRLEEERRRTKLYELNEKCKKMLSKSHERIVPARNVPEERMRVLRQLEDKAAGEIGQLDSIINDLIDKANQNKLNNLNKHESALNLPLRPQTHHPSWNAPVGEAQQGEGEDELDVEMEEWEVDLPQEQDLLSINRVIFEKTSEELLQMDYIPI